MLAEKSDQKRQIVGLDGLRGTAAIAVVAFHLRGPAQLTTLFPSGYLAVDLFFMLSGFVIAHAYEAKLTSGLSLGRFVLIRAIRLYPLYILGCAFSLTAATITALWTGHLWIARDSLYAAPFALFMLPRPSSVAADWFTLNQPAWSLFAEWIVNILYAALLPVLTSRVLAFISATSFITLAGLAVEWQTLDIPSSSPLTRAISFMLRAIFAFPMGVLFHRAWVRGSLPALRLPVWVALILICLTFAIPDGARISAFALPLCLIMAFPLAIIIAVCGESTARLVPWMTWAGLLSYPIYTLHYPFIETLTSLWSIASLPELTRYVLVFIPVGALSWGCIRYYDVPARLFIEYRLGIRDREIIASRPL